MQFYKLGLGSALQNFLRENLKASFNYQRCPPTPGVPPPIASGWALGLNALYGPRMSQDGVSALGAVLLLGKE